MLHPHRQTRMLRSFTLRPSEDVTLRPYPSFSRLQNETRNIINGGLRSMKCPAVLCKHENHYWVSKGWSSIQIYKADLMGDSISVANREANEILRFVTCDTRNVKHNVEKLRNKSRTCEQKLCKRQGRLKASSKQKLLTKRLCKDNERWWKIVNTNTEYKQSTNKEGTNKMRHDIQIEWRWN